MMSKMISKRQAAAKTYTLDSWFFNLMSFAIIDYVLSATAVSIASSNGIQSFNSMFSPNAGGL